MASNDSLSDWTYVVFIAIVPYCHTDVEFVKATGSAGSLMQFVVTVSVKLSCYCRIVSAVALLHSAKATTSLTLVLWL